MICPTPLINIENPEKATLMSRSESQEQEGGHSVTIKVSYVLKV